MNILINNQKANFSNSNFPILISGAEKSGTSFFSICLLADLLNSGRKVLLFSAYPAAKEAFREQIASNKENAFIIESGDEKVFIDTLKEITDLSERIILIKNIENYSEKIFNAVKDLKFVIFSGDLDKCQFSNDLLKKCFALKIFFSYSERNPIAELKLLPKYSGLIIGKRYNGVIKLEI